MERAWHMIHDAGVAISSNAGVLSQGSLHCRPVDATGAYDPSADLQAFEAVLSGAPAADLEALYGFRADFDENGGEVRFRISMDGGATWNWWDGDSWEVASAGDWNTADEIDANLPALPVAPGRDIAVTVRITPATPAPRQCWISPEVRVVAVYCDWTTDWLEDLARSLKRKLDTEVRTRSNMQKNASAQSTITLPASPAPHRPIEAYDLTADPGRTADLFHSLTDGIVRLASSVTGIVEVQYHGAPPVHIATDVDFQLSELPAVVLQFPAVREVREHRLGDRTLDWAKSRYTAMARQHPLMLSASVIVSVQATTEQVAMELQAAVDRVLAADATIVSVGTGEQLVVTDYGPSNDGSQVSDGLFVRQTAANIRGQAWLDEVEELPLVREVFMGIGSMTERHDRFKAAPAEAEP